MELCPIKRSFNSHKIKTLNVSNNFGFAPWQLSRAEHVFILLHIFATVLKNNDECPHKCPYVFQSMISNAL